GHGSCRRCEKHRSEVCLALAGLDGAPVLDVEAEEACVLAQVIDVAAQPLQSDQIAGEDGAGLRLRQTIALTVRLLVAGERLSVGGIIKRKTHPVEGIALAGVLSGQDVGTGNFAFHNYSALTLDGHCRARSVSDLTYRINGCF